MINQRIMWCGLFWLGTGLLATAYLFGQPELWHMNMNQGASDLSGVTRALIIFLIFNLLMLATTSHWIFGFMWTLGFILVLVGPLGFILTATRRRAGS